MATSPPLGWPALEIEVGVEPPFSLTQKGGSLILGNLANFHIQVASTHAVCLRKYLVERPRRFAKRAMTCRARDVL